MPDETKQLTEQQQKKLDQIMKIRENLELIKYKIVVMSGKGGVGKSTVATNLAFALTQHGCKVGLMDVDINGPDIAKMLGIEDQRLRSIVEGDRKAIAPVSVPPGLKVVSMAFLLEDRDTPVIWRGPVKMGAIKQFLSDVAWGELDYLIIDLPPGTGDESLSIAQLIPGRTAIIVTTPQDVALLDSRKAVGFAKKLNMPVIGILENMSGLECPHCNKQIELFKIGGAAKAATELGIPFLGAIPIDPKIVETGDSGEPFVMKYSKSKSAVEFNEIVKKVEEFLESEVIKL
jgi:Mrp family chromosome partitioning ATPase